MSYFRAAGSTLLDIFKIMRLSRGVSNEINVETIATDVMMILWIKATITLPFRSSLTNLVVQWWQRICLKVCCTFGVFVLLINLRVHTVLNSCPAIFQTWKKFGKQRSSLEKWERVLSFFQSCNNLALFVIIFFRFGEILLNLAHTLVFLHSVFKVSIDHLFNNLESGKETIVLEKVWKKSWISDPKIYEPWHLLHVLFSAFLVIIVVSWAR